MKVGEIKKVLPLADVYELLPDGTYLIVTALDQIHPNTAQRLASMCGRNVLVLTMPNPEGAVKLLEGDGIHDIDLKLLREELPWKS